MTAGNTGSSPLFSHPSGRLANDVMAQIPCVSGVTNLRAPIAVGLLRHVTERSPLSPRAPLTAACGGLLSSNG